MKRFIAAMIWFSPLAPLLVAYVERELLWCAGSPLLAALIWAAINTGKLPIVVYKNIRGANGRNWPLYVEIDKRAPHHVAVLAQEIYEANRKTNPLHFIKSRTTKGQRDLELRGHEVEVQAAVMLRGVAEFKYRQSEAASMKTGYKCFKKDSEQDIINGMMKHSRMASKWVRKRFAKRYI